MKKLTIGFLLIIIMATPGFADEVHTDRQMVKSYVQKIFAPNDSSLVFFNCFNTSESANKACESLDSEMTKAWPLVKDPATAIFFRNEPPYIKKYVTVDIGGRLAQNGYLNPSPDHVIILSQTNGDNYFAMIPNQSTEEVVSNVKKLFK